MSRDVLRDKLYKIWVQWHMGVGAKDQVIMRPDIWLQAQFEQLRKEIEKSS